MNYSNVLITLLLILNVLISMSYYFSNNILYHISYNDYAKSDLISHYYDVISSINYIIF